MTAVCRVLATFRARAGRLLLAVAAAAGAELAALALMATAAWLLARAAEQPELAALSVAIVAVRALAVARGGFRYAERMSGHDAVLRCLADLRGAVYAGLSRRPSARSGDLLTRVVSDVDAAQDLLLRCLLPAVVAGVVGTAAVVFTVVALPTAGVVLAVGVLLAGVLLPLAAAGLAGRGGRRLAGLRGALADHTVDLVHGAADLAAYGAAGRALERAGRDAERLARIERRAALGNGALTAAGPVVQAATALVVVALAVGTVSGPMVAALGLAALAAVESALPVVGAGARYPAVAAGVRRVADLLDEPESIVDFQVLPAGRPQLRLDRVSVCYGDRPALRGVDLDLPAGRRVAVVGPSGAGKSTLLAVLLGFVPIRSGRATLNGVELSALDGDALRTVVRGALSDAHVFHASVRANLLLAWPDAGPDELRAVADRVRLPAWIESLPAGWDTVVGQDGGQLSGGQRQRIVLARALLWLAGRARAGQPAPVLLLDEPTEGLDPAMADELLADVLVAAGDATVVCATHRLAGLAAFDEIVVLESGRVTQRGRHHDLLARPGYYRDRYHAEHLTEV